MNTKVIIIFSSSFQIIEKNTITLATSNITISTNRRLIHKGIMMEQLQKQGFTHQILQKLLMFHIWLIIMGSLWAKTKTKMLNKSLYSSTLSPGSLSFSHNKNLHTHQANMYNQTTIHQKVSWDGWMSNPIHFTGQSNPRKKYPKETANHTCRPTPARLSQN